MGDAVLALAQMAVSSMPIKKKPVKGMARHLLQRYVESTMTKQEWEMTTFKYIASFVDFGVEADRLPVACYDYGYTVEELSALRVRGQKSVDIAKEILGRPAKAKAEPAP